MLQNLNKRAEPAHLNNKLTKTKNENMQDVIITNSLSYKKQDEKKENNDKDDYKQKNCNVELNEIIINNKEYNNKIIYDNKNENNDNTNLKLKLAMVGNMLDSTEMQVQNNDL